MSFKNGKVLFHQSWFPPNVTHIPYLLCLLPSSLPSVSCSILRYHQGSCYPYCLTGGGAEGGQHILPADKGTFQKISTALFPPQERHDATKALTQDYFNYWRVTAKGQWWLKPKSYCIWLNFYNLCNAADQQIEGLCGQLLSVKSQLIHYIMLLHCILSTDVQEYQVSDEFLGSSSSFSHLTMALRVLITQTTNADSHCD